MVQIIFEVKTVKKTRKGKDYQPMNRLVFSHFFQKIINAQGVSVSFKCSKHLRPDTFFFVIDSITYLYTF